MKTAITLILALCLVLSFIGCSKTPGESTPTTSQQPTTQPEATEETSAPTKPAIPNETLPAFSQKASIEKTVLVDENDVKITATDLHYSRRDVSVNLLIENNSGKNLSFRCETLAYSRNSVNGFMVEDGYLNCDVTAGNKANESVKFSYDKLRLIGIQELSDIELGFCISDEDNNDFFTGPRQICTSAYDAHDYNTNCYQATVVNPAAMGTFRYTLPYFSKDVSYEENGIRALSAALLLNQKGEHLLILELENTTEQVVCLEASDMVINNLAVQDHACANTTITPGKHGLLTLPLESVLKPEYWSIHGIKEIDSASITLRQMDEKWTSADEPKAVQLNMKAQVSPLDLSGTEIFNQDGLRILSKTIIKDTSEYSKDLHVLLVAENTGSAILKIDDVYDSLSVNGFMTDYTFRGQTMQPGQAGFLEITLNEKSLAENKIASPQDVSELKMEVKLTTGNKESVTIPLKIAY